MKKTYSAKPSEITRKWYIVDASSAPLGRLATVIATHLMGKHKPTYTAHIDSGDYVIVINAEKLVVTGNKLEAKKYYRYSGFPSGLKETTLAEKLAKNPAGVIEAAVRGMLPKNKLMDERLKRLRVFAGEEHGHSAQQPVELPMTIKKASK